MTIFEILEKIPILPYPLEWVLWNLVSCWPNIFFFWIVAAMHVFHKSSGSLTVTEMASISFVVGFCAWLVFQAFDKGYAVG